MCPLPWSYDIASIVPHKPRPDYDFPIQWVTAKMAGPNEVRHSTSDNTLTSDTAVEPKVEQPQDLHRTRTVTEADVEALPFRTLSPNADLTEYTQETANGEILREVRSTATGMIERYELVTFKINDPENPKNWSKAYKWWCTMVVALTCFVVAFDSSVISSDLESMAEEFGVGREVSLLAITFFVIGFGVGPMAFAPMSEILGRRVIYASTLLVAVIFTIPQAVAQNIETLLVTRFIAGLAFSAPMTLVGGTLADMWKNEERGIPMAAFSAAPFIGPGLGPLVGGYLCKEGWRWLYWIQLIASGAVWFLITFTVPETYAPTLLKRRAKKMRKETGNENFVTAEEIDMRPFRERLMIFLIRPFQLLFREPIVLFLSIYMSVLYGLLYMFFVAFPIIYKTDKGYDSGSTGLMFLPLVVGVLLGALCGPLVNKHYVKLSEKANGNPPPEARLWPMMLSCWAIPIGLFIFSWTSFPDLHWAGPAFGGFPVGFGIIFLYNSANNYLVDSYQHQAASALAAKTFLRSWWGAGVVLFTQQMYDRMGHQWASTFLAFIGLLCCAIPFVFFFYGERIRAHSHYAFHPDEENQEK